MIVHYFEQIPGWFDFHDLYADAVARAKDGAKFLEIGTFMGKSLAFLAVEIVNSQKKIELWSVDSREHVTLDVDSPDPTTAQAAALYNGKSLFSVLCSNLVPCLAKGLEWEHYVTDSVSFSKGFPDETFDFIFIDADHEYASVLGDIRAWWPKVKPGGRLAGHDHTPSFPGVETACRQVFGTDYRVSRSSWFRDKI